MATIEFTVRGKQRARISNGASGASMLRLIICLALFVSAAWGRTASITGRVTDASGGVVVGADVTAKSTATNVTFSARTNSEGYYSVSDLAPGTYDVTVNKSGFAPVEEKGLELQVEQVARLDV